MASERRLSTNGRKSDDIRRTNPTRPETMADIRAGRIDPKLGSTLGYLGMLLLRAFEVVT